MTDTTGPHRNRWLLEVLLCGIGGMMVTMDGTIVNVILPGVQESFRLSPLDRQWLSSLLFLTMGTCLLVAGWVVDRLGARRALLISALGFGAASAAVGLSRSTGQMLSFRLVQGVFGALLNPACLAIVAGGVAGGEADQTERAGRFAVFGSMASAGAPVGMLIGGGLSQLAGWRICMFVNLGLGFFVTLAALRIIGRSSRRSTPRRAFDMTGALLVTTSVGLIVYGTSRGGNDWRSLLSAAKLFVPGLMLFMAFLAWEARVSEPLIDWSIVRDKSRVATLIALLLIAGPFLGVSIQLSFYLRNVQHFSPGLTGLGLLPSTIGSILGSALTGVLVAKLGPRKVLVAGGACCGLGLLLLLSTGQQSSYWLTVLPGDLLSGLGLGFSLMPATNLIMHGSPMDRVGVTGAMINSSMQIGAALAITVVNSVVIAASNSAAILSAGAVAGYHIGIVMAAALAFVGMLLVLFKASDQAHAVPI